MCKRSPGKIIGIGFFIILAIFGFGYITMLLWNWLVPTLFAGPVITYWQTLGLLVLSKILFSGGGHGSGHRDHHSESHKSWKSHLGKKLEQAQQAHGTPEKDTADPAVNG